MTTPDDLGWLTRKLRSIDRVSTEEQRAVENLPFTKKRLEGGQDIVREKDQPTQCCLILDGWACRYKLLSEGKRQILSFHIAGDIPDLQSLHLKVMDHNLATVTPCTVALIPHEGVHDLVRRFPGICGVLWRDTLVDAAIFREWMTGIGRRSAYGRIAHLFCEIYVKMNAIGLADDYRCEWPITQVDIADALGLSNVHVNRVLQDLRSRKLISLRGRALVIENWDALREAAEFDPLYLHLEP
ncbi:MAG: Crp/Fnr family transcriptional regulator [Methylobacterium sp.]|uniref:Crp/Fnr family transcriptional regulator n=1 Tax=Methylobacterium sp. TaxID=409 RepID=UPI0025E54922|nr:Crp/Fnr family transcriptional regulator [Methylobacterium sp.]MBX9932104.1 Crp/Fnr family transcriptional regulator [Methylobacterium sp.]